MSRTASGCLLSPFTARVIIEQSMQQGVLAWHGPSRETPLCARLACVAGGHQFPCP